MKNCKYCMSEIDESAIVCPICKKSQNQKRNTNIIIIILAFLLIVVIVFILKKDIINTKDRLNRIRNNSTEATRNWLSRYKIDSN